MHEPVAGDPKESQTPLPYSAYPMYRPSRRPYVSRRFDIEVLV